jgi:hypothetical protein
MSKGMSKGLGSNIKNVWYERIIRLELVAQEIIGMWS